MGTQAPAGPAVYASIAAVQTAINAVGISKGRTANAGGQYKYRGIDDVLNTFSEPLTHAKLMVLPNCVRHEMGKVKTKTGEIERAIVEIEFTFLSLIDGSIHKIGNFIGEGSDSLDKATAKAHAVALRTCLLQTFNCPLGAKYDPEAGDEEGEDGAGDTPQPNKQTKAPIAKSQQQGKSVTGEVVNELAAGQKRILEAALVRKGLTWEDLAEEFPTINAANFNAVSEHIKAQG